jgi:hypothetical protein
MRGVLRPSLRAAAAILALPRRGVAASGRITASRRTASAQAALEAASTEHASGNPAFVCFQAPIQIRRRPPLTKWDTFVADQATLSPTESQVSV